MFFYIITQDACEQDQVYFIRHNEKQFHKKCSRSCHETSAAYEMPYTLTYSR